MREKKSNVLILFMVVALTLAFVLKSDAMAADTSGISKVTTQPYNVMLLIDKSGSMNATDQPKLSLSAACQFVDQLCTTYGDQALTTNVGVMSFSQTTEVVSPLLQLNTEENTNYLKSEINSIQYDPVNTGGTDLGTAVYDAASALQKQNSQNSRNMIVMFTDGYSENVLDGQAAAAALDQAFQICEELGSEIFIVGLNYQNKIKEEGQLEIFRIADTAQKEDGILDKAGNDTYAAGDKVNYMITDNIGDVREFYVRLYANMFDSVLEIFNKEFQITTGGVAEANVTVYSDTEISTVEVLDPDGNVMIENGENYFVAGDSFYKVIRILNPRMGTWKVNVVCGDENYTTCVVRFYGIEAAISASWGKGQDYPDSGLDEENVGQVAVTPMFKDEPYQDAAFAEGITEKKFTADKDGSLAEYPLVYDENSGKFIGYFPVSSGDYHITASIASETMSRTVECNLTVNAKSEDSLENGTDLGVFTVKNQESLTVDLASLTGNDSITVQSAVTDTSLEENPKDIISTVDYTGSKVIINGKHIGSDKVKFEVIDVDKREYELTGRIEVEFRLFWYHIAAAAAGLLLFLLLVHLIYVKTRRVPGCFEYTVTVENNGDSFVLDDNIVSYPKGKKFSLWKLMDIVVQSCRARTNMDETEKIVSSKLEEERKGIKENKLVLTKDGKKKLYKLKRKKADKLDLKRKTLCYGKRADGFMIELRFKPKEDNFDGWGEAVDDKTKKNRGRKSSRKAPINDEW